MHRKSCGGTDPEETAPAHDYERCAGTLRAFHVYSTEPKRTWFGRRLGANWSMEDFELLTLILSTLKWRQHNGFIKMYTDATGAAYFHSIGLADLWDGGIDTETLEETDLETNTSVFWAFARTLALAREVCPCFLMDTDLIVWRNISPLICSDFMAIHSEPLDFRVYVPKEQLQTPPGYTWDGWDWTVIPCNAALMYFGRDNLRQFCVARGLEFMQGNFIRNETMLGPAHAVFVEQRLWPMCVKKFGVSTRWFLKNYHGYALAQGSPNNVFTHLWVYKSMLMTDAVKREEYCRRAAGRILRDFPEMEESLERIEKVRPYLCRPTTA